MTTPDCTSAESPPTGLGALNSNDETLKDVRDGGWIHEGLRARIEYIGADHGKEVRRPLIFRVDKIESSEVRLRRRPCDAFTLRGREAAQFEQQRPDYFGESKYSYPREGLSFDPVLKLAANEFGKLDYLQPLSSVMQVMRPDPRIPFVNRYWHFGDDPSALIKSAPLRLRDGTLFRGICICSQSPSRQLLRAFPNNYLIFRNVVGHQIGHYWWSLLDDSARAKTLVDLQDESQVKQAISLFSIFLIMYRGYWQRHALSRDKLEHAMTEMPFESAWAARNESRILERLSRVKLRETFIPDAKSFANEAMRPADNPLPDHVIDAIREAARDLAERAAPMPFASTASVINQRKIDTFISLVPAPAGAEPTWTATDRKARHVGMPVAPSSWREYQLRIPLGDPSGPDFEQRLRIAYQLAAIRLYGDRFGAKPTLMCSADLERVCDAEARDQARLLALALCAQEGEARWRRLPLDVAELLLDRDPYHLSYLTPRAEQYFQWCAEDPDAREGDERFLAKIRRVSRFGDDVEVGFWGEDDHLYRVSLPVTSFRDQDFPANSLVAGRPFKLFGAASGELRPVPLRRRLPCNTSSPSDTRVGSAVEQGLAAAEPR